MDDQTLRFDLTYVPVEEEQAISEWTQEQATFQQFISQWELEDIPACNVGMMHLMRFAQAHPAMFELVQKRNFTGPPQPFIRAHRLWQRLADHYAGVCGLQ